MSEQDARPPMSEVIPHRPGCGLKVLETGRHRAVCVCDDETHRLRLAYIRANPAKRIERAS